MMIYTAAMDTFYLTDEQLTDTPSRKDGIDDATETTLRIYGCDLIQESGILLRLPQAVMTTGQVLFHRFYCKQSFARFDVKRVAASCVWLASKLEESPRRARHVLNVFRKMECRRENLPVAHLDVFSKKYAEIKMDDLITTERCILKEMGFICHVEHPHKFISNYLATLEAPPELRQEAWNLANDSLRTTLCVRFKSEIVACGVVYAAARRFKVPLPENPPWWKAFGAKKYSIHEVCRVLAHLYSLPKAQYIPVCKDGGSFTTSNRFWDSPTQPIPLSVASTSADPNTIMVSSADFCVPKDAILKVALGQSKKSNEALQSVFIERGEIREENLPRSKSKSENRTDVSEERIRDREREKEKERLKVHDRKRRRDSDREWEQELFGRDRGKVKDRGGQSKEKGKDSGHLEKTKHCSSRDPDYHGSSYSSSREKDRRMYHSYG